MIHAAAKAELADHVAIAVRVIGARDFVGPALEVSVGPVVTAAAGVLITGFSEGSEVVG